MKFDYFLYMIIAIQFIVSIAMWYFSLTAASNYETIWAVLLFVNLILMSLLFLIYLKHEEVFSRD